MPKKWVLCSCGTRNDRAGGRRKCASCAKPLRKLPQQKHKLILREGYEPFVRAAVEIHGVTDESCCVCGKPRTQERNHDRDHDHLTGQPRGLACPGDTGCNVLMPKWMTATVARGIVTAKIEERAEDTYRWVCIAAYLDRVERFYAREASAVG